MTVPAAPARRAAPLLSALLAAAALLFLLYKIAELVLVAFIAMLIGVYLGGVMDLLMRRLRLPRGAALLAALLGTLAALSGVAALLAPAVVQQTQDLIAAVPRYLTELDGFARRLAVNYPVLGRTGIASRETGLVSSVLSAVGEFLRREVLTYATLSGKVLIDGVAVLVMALYLAWRPSVYTGGVVALVPPRHREAARAILADAGASLRAWVGAQLMAMVVLAFLTGVGLWILDVPYWLAFSIFTGLVVMIPFFGTMVSTLLPALLVLGDRGVLAFLAVASVGVIVHLIEANFVHPLIMHHRVQLPPVLTILSVLVMAKLGGLLGLLVAVPTLATAMVLVRHILILRVYGDATEAESDAAHAPPPGPVAEVAATGDASRHA